MSEPIKRSENKTIHSIYLFFILSNLCILFYIKKTPPSDKERGGLMKRTLKINIAMPIRAKQKGCRDITSFFMEKADFLLGCLRAPTSLPRFY